MFAKLGAKRSGNLFVELLMIVVGINIALWFEGWFEELQEAETEQLYLEGLRDDLAVDIKSLENVILNADKKIQNVGSWISMLDELPDAPAEQQAAAMFEPSGYLFFTPNDFTYRSMQESGDFRLLSDSDTKQEVLKLAQTYKHIGVLETNFLQAMDDGYIPMMMNGFDILEMRILDPSTFASPMFRNFMAFTHQDTSGRLEAYRQALVSAQVLHEMIDGQIKH